MSHGAFNSIFIILPHQPWSCRQAVSDLPLTCLMQFQNSKLANVKTARQAQIIEAVGRCYYIHLLDTVCNMYVNCSHANVSIIFGADK